MAEAGESESGNWLRVEALFNQALTLDENARPEFLRQACGADPDLGAEVESLLQHSEADMVSGLNHPNILTIYEFVITAGVQVQLPAGNLTSRWRLAGSGWSGSWRNGY